MSLQRRSAAPRNQNRSRLGGGDLQNFAVGEIPLAVPGLLLLGQERLARPKPCAVVPHAPPPPVWPRFPPVRHRRSRGRTVPTGDRRARSWACRWVPRRDAPASRREARGRRGTQAGARRIVCRTLQDPVGAAVLEPRDNAHVGQARGGDGVHLDLRPPAGGRDLCGPRRARDDGEAARRLDGASARHGPRRAGAFSPRARELRDDLVSVPRTRLHHDPAGRAGRPAQDRGPRRPPGPEGDRLPRVVPRLADRPRAERRRRAHGFRLLWREPHHLADGRPAPDAGHGRHAATQTRRLSQGRRRRHGHPDLPARHGPHPGLVELADRPQGHGPLRRHRRPQRPRPFPPAAPHPQA